jgi:Putative homoserine kinase type II (protein kinase fold)
MEHLLAIVSKFDISGEISNISPLGTGLINDSYLVRTTENKTPDYVLQRINHAIFQNVDILQNNIHAVTKHIRKKLTEKGETDIDRKVLTFLPAEDGKLYYYTGNEYWRLMYYIPRSKTYETINPELSYQTGIAFGDFQSMLADIPDRLEETIPNFHNMEFRLKQFDEALEANSAGKLEEVKEIVEEIKQRAENMCKAERLFREGKLPKRICHCDTKVNNVLFNEDDTILCVIDLDTVMPSFIFSDYGDFLRTAANTGPEDDPNLDNINFNPDIFTAFTKGYLQSAKSFLTPVETENLPYAAMLFPYMQCVRFLTDYLNGDTYYKINYPEHNLIRTRAQLKLLQSVEANEELMKKVINEYLA